MLRIPVFFGQYPDPNFLEGLIRIQIPVLRLRVRLGSDQYKHRSATQLLTFINHNLGNVAVQDEQQPYSASWSSDLCTSNQQNREIKLPRHHNRFSLDIPTFCLEDKLLENVGTNQCLVQTVQTQEIQSCMNQAVPQYGPQSSYLVPETSYFTSKTTSPNIAPQSNHVIATKSTSDYQKSFFPYGKKEINFQAINPHAREVKQDRFEQLIGTNNYLFFFIKYIFSSLKYCHTCGLLACPLFSFIVFLSGYPNHHTSWYLKYLPYKYRTFNYFFYRGKSSETDTTTESDFNQEIRDAFKGGAGRDTGHVEGHDGDDNEYAAHVTDLYLEKLRRTCLTTTV